jgi:hypothetical protein
MKSIDLPSNLYRKNVWDKSLATWFPKLCVCRALKTFTITSPSISLVPFPCHDEDGG